MQTVQTEVSQATTLSGQRVLLVRFCGEGGDCVTVDMAAAELPNDVAAIARAKAILVPTATFDNAANDYDAQSNGDFDEDVATSAHGDGGGVYIFEYRDGECGQQAPPCIMPIRSAAHDEATRFVAEMLGDLQPGQDALRGWLVRVRSDNGCSLSMSRMRESHARLGSEYPSPS